MPFRRRTRAERADLRQVEDPYARGRQKSSVLRRFEPAARRAFRPSSVAPSGLARSPSWPTPVPARTSVRFRLRRSASLCLLTSSGARACVLPSRCVGTGIPSLPAPHCAGCAVRRLPGFGFDDFVLEPSPLTRDFVTCSRGSVRVTPTRPPSRIRRCRIASRCRITYVRGGPHERNHTWSDGVSHRRTSTHHEHHEEGGSTGPAPNPDHRSERHILLHPDTARPQRTSRPTTHHTAAQRERAKRTGERPTDDRTTEPEGRSPEGEGREGGGRE